MSHMSQSIVITRHCFLCHLWIWVHCLENFEMTSPEPLVQIQNNFKEVLLLMPSSKITQLIPLRRSKGPPELYIRNTFKTTFSPEPLVLIQNKFTEMCLMMPSTKIAQLILLSLTKGPPELPIRIILKQQRPLNHWSKLKKISQNCSWCLLPKLHKWFCSAKQRDKKYL